MLTARQLVKLMLAAVIIIIFVVVTPLYGQLLQKSPDKVQKQNMQRLLTGEKSLFSLMDEDKEKTAEEITLPLQLSKEYDLTGFSKGCKNRDCICLVPKNDPQKKYYCLDVEEKARLISLGKLTSVDSDRILNVRLLATRRDDSSLELEVFPIDVLGKANEQKSNEQIFGEGASLNQTSDSQISNQEQKNDAAGQSCYFTSSFAQSKIQDYSDFLKRMEPYMQIVDDASSKYGVCKDLLMTFIYVESRGYANAVNPQSGAAGMVQFMPDTAKAYGMVKIYDYDYFKTLSRYERSLYGQKLKNFKDSNSIEEIQKLDDRFNPRLNIFGSAKYISDLTKAFNGNTEFAIAAYHGGEKGVKSRCCQNNICPTQINDCNWGASDVSMQILAYVKTISGYYQFARSQNAKDAQIANVDGTQGTAQNTAQNSTINAGQKVSKTEFKRTT